MRQKKHHKTTIKNRVLFLMILIVSVQLFAFISTILLTGTRKRLDSNETEILNNSVASRSKTLEDELIQCSDLSGWLEDIRNKTDLLEAESGSSIGAQIQEDGFRTSLLEQLSGTVLPNLRSHGVTGAFLILDDGRNTLEKDAVYLRDLNPQDISQSNHDILVEAGLGKAGFDQGLTLDFNWTSKLSLRKSIDFFQKPMQAALHYPDLTASDFGYWSPAMRIAENDIQIITYTAPLLDSSHTPFGVIGIELSLDYLRQLFSGSELTIDEKSSYFLGCSTPEAPEEYQTVVVNGSYYKTHIPVGSIVTFSPKKGTEGIYTVFNNGAKTSFACSMQPIRLYNTNTPFEEERWVIAGIVRESKLFEASHKLDVALAFALSFSFLVSICGAVITTSNMFAPLNSMMNALGRISPNCPSLPRTKFAEIDKLASEVERLRQSAFRAGSKVADILSVSGLDLGVFEYTEQGDYIFCTEKVFSLAGIPLDGWHENYVDRTIFLTEMKAFGKKISALEEEDGIYYFKNSDDSTQYLEIKCVKQPKEQLYIFMDVTSQILEKQKIKHERDYDVLTNLYNRRAFIRIVSHMIEKCRIKTGVLSMWDLDNLKFINDTYGHDMGDKYICMLAEAFHGLDFPNAITARMSGDEFMVFLYDGEVDAMCRILKELHSDFLKKKLLLSDGDSITVSASAGIAIYGQDTDNYETLSKLADFAMYEIKNREKGGIQRFEKESYERDYILVQGIGELNKIIKGKLIDYVFQPIIDIHSRTIFAYEALMRPRSSVLYNPSLFLKVAEKQSKLKQLEVLTWFLALAQYSQQQKDTCQEKLFLNSISSQCMTRETFLELTRRYGNYFPNLVLEVTESTEADAEVLSRKEAICREGGLQMALDDYGAGYSNNALLLSSNFQYVKIDMSMIQGIHLSEEKQAFVKNVIQFCHKCRTKVVVEGVETLEEYRIVEMLGTDFVQGYFFSKPVARLSDIQIDFERLLSQ